MVEFEKHTGLVYKVFNNKYQSLRHLEDDLIQEGMMALWNACNTFDESKGVAFSTYAVKCISNAMGMFMRKENMATNRCISLDDFIDPDKGSATYADVIEAEDYDRSDKVLMLSQAMEIIKETPQYEIVKMKLQGMSQVQIAKKLGITQCSVSEQLRGLYARVREKMGVEPVQHKKNKKN
nr:MAG TPA: DNA directed RNA polymerase subunit [Caudoviricetes sp.]